MPKDIINQIKPLNFLIKNLGIPIVKIPCIEADDTIGILSKIENKKKNNVYILTNDKDIYQIINSKTFIMNNLYKIIDKKKIKKKYKIFPKNIPDFLSLVGDKSDNIPGVHSIGEKTAQILIQKYGNLKNIYKNINKIHKLKIRNIKNILINLKLTKKKIFFFLRLIKLNLNFKIDKKFKNLKLKKPNNKKLKEFFKKNQFKILKNYKNFY